MKISLNENDIYHNTWFSHFSYISTKCSLNKTSQDTYLTLQGLTGDTDDHFDSVGKDSSNEG